MRQLTASVAIAAAGILLTGCSHDGGSAASSTTSSTTAAAKTPLNKAQLPDLMLSPSDIDTMLGVTGTTSDPPKTALEEDTAKRSDYTLPAECKYALHAALAPVYADSGYTAVYGYHDLAPTPPGADDLESPDVYQFVVLFPAPDQANAFFTTSSQQWPACANRLDTVPADGTHPELQWKVGPVTNANGVLSTTVTLSFSRNGVNLTVPCQRALTVRSNVVVDVDACRKDVGDLGINIANQIAGKIGKQ
ncbi:MULTISPECIES: sensor domain-containing protein [unclassified Mycobacterium]|uniref:sensor domain-containing protein n=1 Tax=unclassified Mycobacterium TaxID=2642494 RepID=UPI0007FD6CF3|nr:MULTISPECIES: sensor domain-containing protein [unclassified Mycobacterium]OBG53571.1 nuclease PIN [Mycobacterium sp. E735]OBG62264.1 nuclease PIN [Mycobacterium sp. E188]OBH36479.1 nuclease PIN [Mycobacterium sp. E183]